MTITYPVMGMGFAGRHRRRSIRLDGYDYAQDGAYFVTLRIQGRACVLGDVRDERVRLSPDGREVARCWAWLAEQYAYIRHEEWIVMPDHLHAIVVLSDGTRDGGRGGSRTARATGPRDAPTGRKPLGCLIGAFKTVSTHRVNDLRGTPGANLWQRGFYEHIVRDERSLHRIRRYIRGNPARWHNQQR